MGEKGQEKKEFTFEYFFNLMLQSYLHQVNRKNFYTDNSCEHIYQWGIETIRRRIAEEPEKTQYYEKMYNIADKFYTLFSDPEVRNEIIQKNMKAQKFIDIYGKYILKQDEEQDKSTEVEEHESTEVFQKEIINRNRRKYYDMSDLFDEQYISSAESIRVGELGKALSYIPRKGVPHEYIDREGKTIIIEEIGILKMKHSININDYITKYKVQKQVGENQYTSTEVYSNIAIIDMDNAEYREAVLQGLLSKENISLSNVDGYIGEVVENPIEMRELNAENEALIGGEYYYKINHHYALKYNPIQLSGVVLHEKYTNLQKRKMIPIGVPSKNEGKGREGTIGQTLEDSSR